MPNSSPRSAIVLVDSQLELAAILNELNDLPTSPPSIFIDIAGQNVGRHGSISVLLLHIAPKEITYLVDVLTLGNDAFSVESDEAGSLQSCLESPTIPKVFFDVRNNSDALFHLYKVSLNGVVDVQLLELGSRKGPKANLACLAKCIEENHTAFDKIKNDRLNVHHIPSLLSQKELNDAIDVRPIEPSVACDCTQSVLSFPTLYHVYHSRLMSTASKFWYEEVQKATIDRIKLSQSKTYEGHSKNMTLGPWSAEYIEEAMDSWNEDVLDRAMSEELDEDSFESDGLDDELDYHDTARDCIGWEDDMIKNGEYF